MASKIINRIAVFIGLILYFNSPVLGQEPSLIVQRGHTAPVTDAVLTQNDKLLITTSYDNTIKIWNKSAAKELHTFTGIGMGFSQIRLATTFDDQYVVAASSGGGLRFFNLENRAERMDFPSDNIWEIAAHPNRSEIATGAENGTFRLFNYQTKTEQKWNIDASGIQQIGYTNDGNYAMAITEKSTAFLYDTKRQEELVFFFNKKITAFAFHPDSKTAIIVEEKNRLSHFQLHKNRWLESEALPFNIKSVSWLNAEEVLLLDDKFRLHRLNIATFQLSDIALVLPRFYTFKNVGNGRILYNEGAVTKIVAVDNLKNIATFSGYVGNVYKSSINAVLFSASERNIITGGAEKKIRFWGEVNAEAVDIDFPINKMVLSPDGKYLACSGEANEWTLVEITTKTALKTFEGHTQAITEILFLNNKTVITSSQDGTVRLWDIEKMTETGVLKGNGKFLQSLACHENTIAAADMFGEVLIWHTARQERIKVFSVGDNAVHQLRFSADGKQIFVAKDDSSLQIWDWATAKLIETIPLPEMQTSNLEVSDNQFTVSTLIGEKTAETAKEKLILSYRKTGEKWALTQTFNSNDGGIFDFATSQNGRWLVSSGTNGVVRLWDGKMQKLLATLYTLGGGEEWALVTEDGLFDASPKGMELLHYVNQNEVIALSQLKERYYEPDLLQKLLGYNDEPIRSVNSFSDAKLYPDAVVKLAETSLTLNVRLTARNGGIGKVSVFINQKEIIENANENRQNALVIPLAAYRKYLLADTTNSIGIKVFNAEGWMESPLLTVEYWNKKTLVTTKTAQQNTDSNTENKPQLKLKKGYQPKLYALLIGTSNYRGEALDLSFADKDATDMANAFQLAGTELFGEKNTTIQLLTTAKTEAEQPSKANIEAAFERISAVVNADDVFVLYLSGHGVNFGGTASQFYYLTQSIASEDITDEQIRNHYTISSQEFTTYLKKIPANKQIMILDACSSGSLVENLLSQSRSVSSSQKRALERMKDRTGVFILAGSAANKVSYEASAFGQGLLTYSLLSGMRGASLRENEFVDVMQWFQYAADKVPQLAAVIGGVQRPVIAAPAGTNSFDVGQVTDSVRYKIPLEEVKPLLVRSNFQEETIFEDVLDLGDKLDAALSGVAQEGVASILFLNVKKYPKAYAVKGRYALAENGKVILTAHVLQDKIIIGKVSLEGQADNLEGLIEELLGAVAEALN